MKWTFPDYTGIIAEKTATCDGINLFQKGDLEGMLDNIHVCDLDAYIKWLQGIAEDLKFIIDVTCKKCGNRFKEDRRTSCRCPNCGKVN